MTEQGSNGGWVKAGIGLGAGLLLGLMLAPKAPPNPALRTLDSSLWLQTSGEFRAVCLQTYRFAGERLEQRLKERGKAGKPAAVIMDLDETVFDNSPYQTWLFQQGLEHSLERWAPWETKHGKDVLAVPGAADFIAKAEAAGATVHYISNRLATSKDTAIEALQNLGISTKGIADRLHLMEPKKSDKTERREKVAKEFDVVMLVGDSLTDFSQEFKPKEYAADDDAPGLRKAIVARNALVATHRAKWGAEWIILPNPSYGEWGTMAGKGDPLNVLNPAPVMR